MFARIAGTGSYLPARVVTNADFEARMDTTDAWIRERTGIERRHRVAPGETTVDMAEHASRRAIEASGLKPEQIDLIIVGTTTPDLVFPNCGVLLQGRLGCRGGRPAISELRSDICRVLSDPPLIAHRRSISATNGAWPMNKSLRHRPWPQAALRQPPPITQARAARPDIATAWQQDSQRSAAELVPRAQIAQFGIAAGWPSTTAVSTHNQAVHVCQGLVFRLRGVTVDIR